VPGESQSYQLQAHGNILQGVGRCFEGHSPDSVWTLAGWEQAGVAGLRTIVPEHRSAEVS
jgi:hypothetical protein